MRERGTAATCPELSSSTPKCLVKVPPSSTHRDSAHSAKHHQTGASADGRTRAWGHGAVHRPDRPAASTRRSGCPGCPHLLPPYPGPSRAARPSGSKRSWSSTAARPAAAPHSAPSTEVTPGKQRWLPAPGCGCSTRGHQAKRRGGVGGYTSVCSTIQPLPLWKGTFGRGPGTCRVSRWGGELSHNPHNAGPGAVDFLLLPSVEPGDPRGAAARPDQDWPVFAGGRAGPRDRLNPQELAVLSRELYQQTLPCWTPGWGAGLPRTLENLRAPRSKKGPSALSGAWPGGPLPHRGQGHTSRTQNQRRWPGPLTT